MLQLIDLFDRAERLGVDLSLHESRSAGAEDALRAWASSRGITVEEREWTVADDHPMTEWRGMFVSVVSAHNKSCSITVHRAKRKAAA